VFKFLIKLALTNPLEGYYKERQIDTFKYWKLVRQHAIFLPKLDELLIFDMDVQYILPVPINRILQEVIK